MAGKVEHVNHAVLSKSERALFTKRRKDAYEALHPETKREATLKQNSSFRQLGETEKADRFTSDTAFKTGQSERSVQLDAERGEKVCEPFESGALVAALLRIRDGLDNFVVRSD